MGGFYGLLGEKLGHSISPEIHSLIFKELNIEGSYNLFEVDKEKLQDVVVGLKALKSKGVNVTIPYKMDVMEYLDEISQEAKTIGAVNTICFNEGRTTGYNTDYFGFGMMLDKYDVQIKDKKAVVLGIGGASMAIFQYLVDKEASEIYLVTRNKEKGLDTLREQIENCLQDKKVFVISYDELEGFEKGDVIINCTPCGMYPKIDSSAVGKNIVEKFSAAVDLIYNPAETLFLRYARECNIKAVNGLYMLVGQAVAAEELWNNIKIDKSITNNIHKVLVEKNFK
ncbi:MAG: shikimate dehydrogenase [Bacillota bacterium]|nr:shikimate dehydrogenase [Bacillota bacterium]